MAGLSSIERRDLPRDARENLRSEFHDERPINFSIQSELFCAISQILTLIEGRIDLHPNVLGYPLRHSSGRGHSPKTHQQ
jgi:hypothetical protein